MIVASVRAEGLLLRAADLDTALNFLSLTVADFEADRLWAEDDTFLLPVIKEALKSPLAARAVLQRFAAAVPDSLFDDHGICWMAKIIGPGLPCYKSVRKPVGYHSLIHQPIASAGSVEWEPFDGFLYYLNRVDDDLVIAFRDLAPEQKDALLLATPLWFADADIAEDDTLKGALHRALGVAVDTTRKVDGDSVLTLFSLVNRAFLAGASDDMWLGMRETVSWFQQHPAPTAKKHVDGIEGAIVDVKDTPLGRMVIGGPGPNVYTGDFAVIIDLGGDDQYLGRTGGALGIIGHSISVIIDMSGNDLYRANGMVSQGCGVMGVGALVDLSGNDIYEGGAFCQGAAFCGAGLFFDESGNDTYRAKMFSQGAAVCGVSVLVDGNGRDVYDLGMYGQGYAGTFGAAALVDNGGNDVYRAGGLQTHTPLLPEDYRSFAQGFAIGSRPRGGGGIALLHDRAGNDFYNAEVYAQGVGYWYSLGGLIDDAGNDVYNATQYVQGAGIHLAAGVLEDGGGDDHYGSRFGPGQGGAHDLAVGMLYDHSGDDQYTISGGQGMAISNSAALFLDATGNDTYTTTEPDLGQGGVREARSFGNLGVFVDGEGKDFYAAKGHADSSLWLSGLYAIGYDVARDSVRPREAPVDVKLVPADTLRSVEDLFRDAAKWEVTDNRVIVRRARLALEAKWAAAIPWVAAHKLTSLEALERRATVELFKAHPDSAAPYLFTALETGNRALRRNVIGILAEMKYIPAATKLRAALSDTAFARLRPALLTALGEINDSSAVPVLIEYCTSPVERERIAATISLGKLADVRGHAALLSRLEDSIYTVRSAAIVALGSQKPDVRTVLEQTSLSTASSPVRLEALQFVIGRLAAKWKTTADSTDVMSLTPLVVRGLQHPLPRVRGAALLAAASYWSPDEVARMIAKFRASPDPVLRARVRQAELLTR